MSCLQRSNCLRERREGERRASTVLELILVIAIIGIMLAISAAAVAHVRAAAVKAKCADNLRQIGLALQSYHTTHGTFPPGCSYDGGRDPYPYMAWSTRILPYLEQPALWEQSVSAYGIQPAFNQSPHPIAVVLPVYACPSDPRTGAPGSVSGFAVGLTSYLGIEGKSQFRHNGILYLDSHVRLSDITDGTTSTLLVGERPPSADNVFGWWYAGMGQTGNGSGDMVLGVRERNYWYNVCPAGPYHFEDGRIDNLCDTFHFWSPHPGGASFLFADGSVRFLTYSVDPLMPALASRNGKESVSPP